MDEWMKWVSELIKLVMKANFDISLPSIPGKGIKFKIQDIKSTAFGTQKARFPDNKSLLTKKFVESFSNFHQQEQEAPKLDDDQETQAESDYFSRSRLVKGENKFRPMVSDNKKFLIPIFNEIRRNEKNRNFSNQSFAEGSNLNKTREQGISYSFSRSGADVGQDMNCEQSKYGSSPITDNYYFTSNLASAIDSKREEDKAKRQHPSSVFKNETRKRFEERFYKSEVPGPGSYLKPKEDKQGELGPKSNKKSRKSIKKGDEEMDYKRLKQVITNIVAEQPELEAEQNKEEKEIKNNYMFIQDDRDRFGKQAFPIAPKLNVPGPGAYDIKNTMEEQGRKILLVEEQRKLLKEWFNN